MSGTDDSDGFLARWSRRKAQVRHGAPPPEPAAAGTATTDAGSPTPSAAAAVSPTAPPSIVQAVTAEATPSTSATHQPPPPPTLADVAELTRESDYSRFVGRGVEPQVRNAALKKLFTDPHFNVMDGLDTYIDDYGKPDPIPEGMLRQMTQSKFLGLFKEEEEQEAAAELALDAERQAALNTVPNDPGAPNALPATTKPDTATAATPEATPDENSDLRLQPHHATGRSGPEPGPGQDGGREC
jgi:Protein of unknown function (DUF3306)